MRDPCDDDRLIRSIINQSVVSQTILVAHDLGLFEIIGSKKKIAVISEELNIPVRSTNAIILICVSSGLILKDDNFCSLTDYAKEYFLKESPYYFGDVLDLIIQQNEVRSLSSIKNAILQGKPQIYDGCDLFETNSKNHELLNSFIKAMHGKSIGPAQAWVKVTPLSKYKKLLDIGGGAGTHTILACMTWQKLTGIIFDMPPVCEISKKYIQKYNMEARMCVYGGDMWKDNYPEADIHLYSDILHDWDKEHCNYLINKSFSSLPRNGKLIIHEMLFNDDKIGPKNVAAYNMNMLLWTQGQQFSQKEIQSMLVHSGFSNIEITPTFGDWCIVTGEKLK